MIFSIILCIENVLLSDVILQIFLDSEYFHLILYTTFLFFFLKKKTNCRYGKYVKNVFTCLIQGQYSVVL